MKHTVIDLGSNSIRLSVYECENNQTFKIFNEKEIAGLAGYVLNDILPFAGIQKACTILNNFKEIASKFVEPSNIHLFATASLRNIKNRNEAINIITEITSLVPDILEGSEEATFGFDGVSKFINCDNGIMIDIGGASTEFVLFKDYEAVTFTSVPIGCLNLAVKYVNKIIPAKTEKKQINNEIKEQFSKIEWAEDIKCPLIVGTGGTLRAVLKLSHVLFEIPSEQNDIKADYVKEILKLLKNNTGDIYHTVYKTIPERIMTISTGLMILNEAIKGFDCDSLFISNYGIREGYLIDRVIGGGAVRDDGDR